MAVPFLQALVWRRLPGAHRLNARHATFTDRREGRLGNRSTRHSDLGSRAFTSRALAAGPSWGHWARPCASWGGSSPGSPSVAEWRLLASSHG